MFRSSQVSVPKSGECVKCTLKTHFFGEEETNVIQKLFKTMPVYEGYIPIFRYKCVGKEWIFYCEKDERYSAEFEQTFDSKVFLNKTTELVCEYVMDEKTRAEHEKQDEINRVEHKKEAELSVLNMKIREYKKSVEWYEFRHCCLSITLCLILLLCVTQGIIILALFILYWI